MFFIEEENTVRYIKKKDSDVSKANKKSKHKHIYDKEVIFEYNYKKSDTPEEYRSYYMKRTYCSVCGKMNDDFSIRELLKLNNKEEIIANYPNIMIITLKNGDSPIWITNINEVL